MYFICINYNDYINKNFINEAKGENGRNIGKESILKAIKAIHINGQSVQDNQLLRQ